MADEKTPPEYTIGPDITKEDAVRLQRAYEAVSKNIERENALIHYRITWAILLSAGILAAEGVIINYVKDQFAADYWYNCIAQGTVIFLSAVAIFFCAMSGHGVRAAQRQMETVKEPYILKRAEFDVLGFPQPYGETRDHRIGNYNAFSFPLALMLLWSLFASAQLYQFGKLWFDKADFDRQASEKTPWTNKSGADIVRALGELGVKVDALKPPTKPIPLTKR